MDYGGLGSFIQIMIGRERWSTVRSLAQMTDAWSRGEVSVTGCPKFFKNQAPSERRAVDNWKNERRSASIGAF